MDFLAYFQWYRWILKGEWVYIRDNTMEFYGNPICHWVRPQWLQENRWRNQYDVIEYENW